MGAAAGAAPGMRLGFGQDKPWRSWGGHSSLIGSPSACSQFQAVPSSRVACDRELQEGGGEGWEGDAGSVVGVPEPQPAIGDGGEQR